MKKTSICHPISSALICCALGSITLAPAVHAQGARGNDAGANRSSATTTAQNQRMSNADNVRVSRASNYLGTDVLASDGRKVGDIVDYYFELSSAPHLSYVIVMTGGFLDLGGDTRAVPASAITFSGDTAKVDIASDQFWDVPVLPENWQRFITDRSHRQRISQIFGSSGRMAGSDTRNLNQREQRDQRDYGTAATRDPNTTAAASGSRTATTDGTATAGGSTGSARAARVDRDDQNRAGAMTGRAGSQGEMQLVSYSELRNADAYAQDGGRLGFFADAWINLEDNRAPYVEITPTFQPFRTNYDRRYAIPTAKIAGKREYYGYTVNVTASELSDAEPVSETQGVRMLQDGTIGNAVLRVTVPQR